MLNRTLLLAAGLLSLTAAPTARAQNYRPFGPGRTYHYRQTAPTASVADSLFTFRIDSIAASGNAEVLYFNRTIPGPDFDTRIAGRRVNVFGGWMRWQDSTGTAIFGAADTTATVEIRTREARQTPWTFAGTLTAMITRRSVDRVFGQLDTLLSIRISDGRTLLLSRRFGIVDGTNLGYYLDRPVAGRRPRRDLVLTAIPEVSPEGIDLRWDAIYDLQPGDTLHYFVRDSYEQISPGPGQASYSARNWEMVTVRQRQASANGDTLRFACQLTRRRTQYDNPDFAGNDTTTYDANVPYPIVAIRPPGGFLTGTRIDPYAFGPSVGAVGWQRPDSLANLPQLSVTNQFVDATSSATFATGLGEVASTQFVGGAGNSYVTRRLIGFVKSNGARRWGNTAVPQPLAAPTDRVRLPGSLAPNPAPAGTAPVLTFTLDQPQAVSLVLYDAVGRVVWQQKPVLAAGSLRLPIAADAALAPGLYRLRVTLADGRQRLLPLVRE
ncbi:MAG: T9SS type A sorting domain-containing protein [Hymenobacteraceae bacterium]|nr:T9SS type A sorting domain-containing protein [Hymenobacteraceae bacterium]